MALFRYFKVIWTFQVHEVRFQRKFLQLPTVRWSIFELQQGNMRGLHTKFTPEQKGNEQLSMALLQLYANYEKWYLSTCQQLGVANWCTQWPQMGMVSQNLQSAKLFPKEFANGLSTKILSLKNLALYGNLDSDESHLLAMGELGVCCSDSCGGPTPPRNWRFIIFM